MQQTAATVDRLTDELEEFIGQVFAAAEGQAFHLAAGLDLSLTQLRVLFILHHSDQELALHQLAEQANLSLATIGRAVDGLTKEGMILRREDEHDRRVKRVSLSEAGEQTVHELCASRRDGLRTLAAGLDEHERAQLSRALAPILARFDPKDSCPHAQRQGRKHQ